jgi:glycosyltransferase involved in cell wall biosynthesis
VRTAVSVVVPVCNEEDNLPGLLRAMDGLAVQLRDRYELELVLVDDGSRDGSWRVMQELAVPRARTQILRHEHNRGIAAAIATGLRAARSETVVSIDCDCSYDPAEIGALVALLADADVVTASPYHPQGKVRNVPRWRLVLSRTLSWLYRRATGGRLHTWTSCFRAYRKSAVQDIQVDHQGFLGIAEFLVRAVARGLRVVEYPAMLESRLLGHSKLKTLRTIRGHLGLLWQIRRGRVR